MKRRRSPGSRRSTFLHPCFELVESAFEEKDRTLDGGVVSGCEVRKTGIGVEAWVPVIPNQGQRIFTSRSQTGCRMLDLSSRHEGCRHPVRPLAANDSVGPGL